MSNFEYGFLADELSSALLGKRFEKAYELGTDKFRISFGQADLIVELAKRMHITKYIEKSPEKPSDFAMGMRKYLDGAKLSSVKQLNRDRILVFEFERRMGYTLAKFSLIFEMFAKGNLLICDETGKILRSYKREEGKDRLVKNGVPYSPPSPSALSPSPTESELKALLASFDSSVSSALSKLPLGTMYLKEALARSKIEAKKKASELSAGDISGLAKSLRSIVEKPQPIIYSKDNAPAEFSLCALTAYSGAEFKHASVPSLSAAADEYFFSHREEEELGNPEIAAKLEKAKLKLEKQQEYDGKKKDVDDSVFHALLKYRINSRIPAFNFS